MKRIPAEFSFPCFSSLGPQQPCIHVCKRAKRARLGETPGEINTNKLTDEKYEERKIGRIKLGRQASSMGLSQLSNHYRSEILYISYSVLKGSE